MDEGTFNLAPANKLLSFLIYRRMCARRAAGIGRCDWVSEDDFPSRRFRIYLSALGAFRIEERSLNGE